MPLHPKLPRVHQLILLLRHPPMLLQLRPASLRKEKALLATVVVAFINDHCQWKESFALAFSIEDLSAISVVSAGRGPSLVPLLPALRQVLALDLAWRLLELRQLKGSSQAPRKGG